MVQRNFKMALKPLNMNYVFVLTCFSSLGWYDIVEILLRNNAFVNVKSVHGLTPLDLATERSN